MRKKLLQNTLFAAMTAWALYGLQAHADQPPAYTLATGAALHR